MRLTPRAQTVQVVSHSALPPVAEPAEIDRLVSASIDGGEPIYRLDNDAIRDLCPHIVLSQNLCAVCAVPSGHVNAAVDVLGCQAEVVSLDPSSLDDVLDCVLEVGRVAGVENRAREIVAGLRIGWRASEPPSMGSSGPACSRLNGVIPHSMVGTGYRR
jgi:iron complex transport system substrate-binding protein